MRIVKGCVQRSKLEVFPSWRFRILHRFMIAKLLDTNNYETTMTRKVFRSMSRSTMSRSSQTISPGAARPSLCTGRWTSPYSPHRHNPCCPPSFPTTPYKTPEDCFPTTPYKTLKESFPITPYKTPKDSPLQPAHHVRAHSHAQG